MCIRDSGGTHRAQPCDQRTAGVSTADLGTMKTPSASHVTPSASEMVPFAYSLRPVRSVTQARALSLDPPMM